eukprot:2784257-Amphidinium_carterae.1
MAQPFPAIAFVLGVFADKWATPTVIPTDCLCHCDCDCQGTGGSTSRVLVALGALCVCVTQFIGFTIWRYCCRGGVQYSQPVDEVIAERRPLQGVHRLAAYRR